MKPPDQLGELAKAAPTVNVTVEARTQEITATVTTYHYDEPGAKP